MEQKGKIRVGNSVFISFMIVAVLFVIIYKCFPMSYAINDDVFMRDIASGAMTGEPDGHLIFVKYALGVLLSGMYRLFPGFDWYGILLTGLIVFCLAIVIYRGWSDIRSLKSRIFYVAFTLVMFVCIGFRHMIMFQWTMTAGIVGATSVFLFYTSSEEERLKNVLEEVLSAFLLILTYCIRANILFMIVPAAGICYLFKYLKVNRKGKWRVSIQHTWYWGLVVGGCAGVMLIESFAYGSKDWKEYLAFKDYRAKVYDYYGVPEFKENQDFYESIGMEEQDVRALENYSLFLVDGIYDNKMEMIAEYAGNIAKEEKGIVRQMVDGLEKIYLDFKSGVYAPLSWFTAIASVLVLMICWNKSSRQFYLLLMCIGIQFLLWYYLGLRGRIVERVSFAMHFYMLFLTMGILYKECRRDVSLISKRRRCVGKDRVLTVCCCTVLLLVSVLECIEVRKEAFQREEQNQENAELCKYLGEQKGNIYLMHTYSVAHYTDTFKLKKDFQVSNMISLGDWPSFSPLEIKRRTLLGVLDPKEALYKQEHVYLVSRFDVDYVEECLRAAYGACTSQDADVVPFRNYLYWIKEFGE